MSEGILAGQRAFQDLTEGNHCWGCGPLNRGGLQIKSYWDGDETVCHWQPHQQHTTWIPGYMNGGIIATIMDCHSIWTAIAGAHRAEGREIGSQPSISYVTGSLQLVYRRPTALDGPLTLRARVKEMHSKKSIVTCSLFAAGEECVQAEMVAVRIGEDWGTKG